MQKFSLQKCGTFILIVKNFATLCSSFERFESFLLFIFQQDNIPDYSMKIMPLTICLGTKRSATNLPTGVGSGGGSRNRAPTTAQIHQSLQDLQIRVSRIEGLQRAPIIPTQPQMRVSLMTPLLVTAQLFRVIGETYERIASECVFTNRGHHPIVFKLSRSNTNDFDVDCPYAILHVQASTDVLVTHTGNGTKQAILKVRFGIAPANTNDARTAYALTTPFGWKDVNLIVT